MTIVTQLSDNELQTLIKTMGKGTKLRALALQEAGRRVYVEYTRTYGWPGSTQEKLS